MTKVTSYLSSKNVALTAAIAIAVLGATALHAQVKQGKTRPAKTGQLMKGIVKPNCGDAKKLLDAGPSKDEDWTDLSLKAALLNEVSFSLMDDGRCPDGVWADSTTKMLREGSANLLKAAEAKDAAAAKTALGTVMKSCKTCHDEHKKDK
ncbi:MAG: cytochrome c [Verrucomicrobiales bacterium]|nr:cytochrome c [Verrucomicrobiales bacterium]